MNDDSDTETPALPPLLPGKIFERLFQSRTVLIHGEVDSRLAQTVTAQLLALAAESDDPITVFIHSEGGHVEAGDSIHDLVRFVKPRVRMIGTGWVASAGTHIYLAAPKKDRFCLPNTRFMIHQPLGGIGRQGDRHPHRGRGDPEGAGAAQPHHLGGHRPAARPRGQGHRPQLLDVARGSARVRHRREDREERERAVARRGRRRAVPAVDMGTELTFNFHPEES
jgi:hypothetical protein